MKRPGIEEFLEKMYKLYEIVIYTASLAIYADPLLDEIDPSNYASYRLFREHCTFYNNAFVKDLSVIGRNMKDVIIADNSPASYLFQPENAIPILTWIDDLNDNKLYELVPVLELLSHFPDVREAIKEIVAEDTIDYVEAEEILQKKLVPLRVKPLVNTWTSDPKLSKEVAALKKVAKEVDNGEHFMGPLTPQYKSMKCRAIF